MWHIYFCQTCRDENILTRRHVNTHTYTHRVIAYCDKAASTDFFEQKHDFSLLLTFPKGRRVKARRKKKKSIGKREWGKTRCPRTSVEYY